MVRNRQAEKAGKVEKLVKKFFFISGRTAKISLVHHETGELTKALPLKELETSLLQKVLRKRGILGRGEYCLLHQQSTQDVIRMGLFIYRMNEISENWGFQILEVELFLEQAVRMTVS